MRQRIIWDKNDEDISKSNYSMQVFSFNDSDIWMAYGLKVNSEVLVSILRDLKKTYPIVEVKMRRYEEHPSFDYYVRIFDAQKKGKPKLRYCKKESNVKLKRKYASLYKDVTAEIEQDIFKLTRTFLPDPPPRRTVKKANRDRILHMASISEQRKVTDEEWEKIKKIIPIARTGVRPKHDRRAIDAILWLLTTGAVWKDIPEDTYGPSSSTNNRLRKWKEDGTIFEIGRILDIDITSLLKKRYY